MLGCFEPKEIGERLVKCQLPLGHSESHDFVEMYHIPTREERWFDKRVEDVGFWQAADDLLVRRGLAKGGSQAVVSAGGCC